jgi:hypothetical protein
LSKARLVILCVVSSRINRLTQKVRKGETSTEMGVG